MEITLHEFLSGNGGAPGGPSNNLLLMISIIVKQTLCLVKKK